MGRNVHAPVASGYGVNLELIQHAAIATGHTSRGLDEDGIVRRVPMLMEYEDNYYESLSLAIARYMLIADEIEPIYSVNDGGEITAISEIESLKIADHYVPVDVNLQALIPYQGRGRITDIFLQWT